MKKWSKARSKKVLAAGLATTVLMSSIIVPVAAAEDFSRISISDRIEEYIAASENTSDPVAELVGTSETARGLEYKLKPATITATAVGGSMLTQSFGTETAENDETADSTVTSEAFSSGILAEGNDVTGIGDQAESLTEADKTEDQKTEDQDKCRYSG